MVYHQTVAVSVHDCTGIREESAEPGMPSSGRGLVSVDYPQTPAGEIDPQTCRELGESCLMRLRPSGGQVVVPAHGVQATAAAQELVADAVKQVTTANVAAMDR